jgi:hypothetical protein
MKSKVILRLNSITMDVEFRGEKGRNELGCPNIGSAPVSDFTNQDNRHRLVWYGMVEAWILLILARRYAEAI